MKHGAAYRPEIDGLRAVAVLMVVIFHAFPASLPGGYIGVDIFFVISGFLITGILHRELQNGDFSILGFYKRRFRRIGPALVLVLASVWVAGQLLLLPLEQKALLEQIVASALFSANILFWSQSGYFDGGALTKPLLHIWSLGVEEQYYLFWPLLLAFAWWRRISLVAVAALIALVSMVCNIMLVEQHGSAAFFLPMPRLWELSVGSLLALTGLKATNRRQAEISSAAGVILIVAGILFLSEALAFPGWWALLPVLGAALVIFGGSLSFVNRRVLSSPLFVWFGLISYPLYLWHWPILSFLSTLAGGLPSFSVRVAAVLASVVLAWLTYSLVELRVRGQHAPLMPKVAPVGFFGVVFLTLTSLVAGPALSSRDNLAVPQPSDLSSAVIGAGREWMAAGCGGAPEVEKNLFDCYADRREPPKYAIWGDSHGGALMPGVLRLSQPGGRWMQMGAPGCPPLAGGVLRTKPGLPSFDTRSLCAKANPAALSILTASQTVEAVFLVAASRIVVENAYATGADQPYDKTAVITGMSAAASALRDAGKRVYLVIDNPVFASPNACLKRVISIAADDPTSCAKNLQQHLQKDQAYRQIIDEFRRRNPFVEVIDPTSALCPGDICSISLNGQFLYTDGDHLSDAGNQLVAKYLLEQLN